MSKQKSKPQRRKKLPPVDLSKSRLAMPKRSEDREPTKTVLEYKGERHELKPPPSKKPVPPPATFLPPTELPLAVEAVKNTLSYLERRVMHPVTLRQISAIVDYMIQEAALDPAWQKEVGV